MNEPSKPIGPARANWLESTEKQGITAFNTLVNIEYPFLKIQSRAKKWTQLGRI
jgi:hypothetical protein